MCSEWTVNPDTLLFENLTQAEELEKLSYEGQIHGNTYFDHSAVIAWFDSANFNDNQKLMTYSVVFLPRAALSASKYFRKELGL